MDSFLRRTNAPMPARERYGSAIPDKVRRQMGVALIAKLKFAGYFLIVWDIVQFCREQNIMCQGRGSAANSTVCLLPRHHRRRSAQIQKLLFERFLVRTRTRDWLAGH